MNTPKHILIAVDNSEASTRAVTYVGTVIGGQLGIRICLLHVLQPMPSSLLEVGGSENPQIEAQEEAEIHQAQANWLAQAQQEAEPWLERARSTLHEAGVSREAVEAQFIAPINGEGVVTEILNAARTHHCGTVVVGRSSFHGLRAWFRHHIGDELIRKGEGVAIWVVE
jgi:nucleotide-binding universal stress UspA family protein